MARTRTIVILVGVISMCACASLPSAPAATAERYPVWWAPEIGIESLDEIDALLAKPFPEEYRHRLYKYVWTRTATESWYQPEDPQPIDSCLALFEWLAADYKSRVGDWDGLEALRRAYAYCYALRALGRARPAQVSYVRDFVMDENTLDYLPALLGPWWCNPYSYPRALRANPEGAPWNRFLLESGSGGGGHGVVVAENRYTLVLQAWVSGDRRPFHVVEIIGRGDFNGDSLDDLLFRVTSVDYSPDTRESEYFLVSRRRGDEVLRVAEFLSPQYGERRRCVADPGELWEPR